MFAPAIQETWMKTLHQMLSAQRISLETFKRIKSNISQGVNLQLSANPLPINFKNTPSVTQCENLVAKRITDYIAIGAVEKLPTSAPIPHGIQPLHVVIKPDKKPRLVIDLSRNLNKFLPKEPFSYSTVEDAIDTAFKNCKFGKLDLANCYFSFPLHPDIEKYFYFRFKNNLYRFIRMPFGLSTAPLECTLLLSVPAFVMEEQGCRFIRYLDDFLFIASSNEELQRRLNIAQEVFASFGLTVNPEKTEGPTEQITFLGIVINSNNQTLSCPPSRVQEIKDILKATLLRSFLKRKQAESLIGKLSFAAKVLPGARPFTRSMIDSLHESPIRSKPVQITEEFKEDLRFWQANLTAWNGRQQWRHARSNPIILATDASIAGFGFHLVSAPNSAAPSSWPQKFQRGSGFCGQYHPKHAHLHNSHRKIAWGELLGVLAALKTYGHKLQNHCVLVLVDNSTDVSIINRQSTKSNQLKSILRSIFQLSLQLNFNLYAKHFPGKDNVLADFLSRPDLHRSDPLAHAPTITSDIVPLLCSVSFVCSSQFLPIN